MNKKSIIPLTDMVNNLNEVSKTFTLLRMTDALLRVEIEIKNINKCDLEFMDGDTYKVVDADMDIESKDIKLTKKMKKTILKNLHYYKEVKCFGCNLSLYDVYFLVGNKKQRLYAINSMLDEYDIDDDIIATDIIEAHKHNNIQEIIVKFTLDDCMDIPLTMLQERGIITTFYYFKVGSNRYRINDIYAAIVKEIIRQKQM